DRTDFDGHIDACNIVHRNQDVAGDEFLESRQADLHRIGSGLHTRKAVTTRIVRKRLTRLVCLLMKDRYGGPWNRRPGGILHVPHDRTIEHLRLALFRYDPRRHQGKAKVKKYELSRMSFIEVCHTRPSYPSD